MRLGELIRCYIWKHELSNVRCAAEIGIDAGSLSRLISGESVRSETFTKALMWSLGENKPSAAGSIQTITDQVEPEKAI